MGYRVIQWGTGNVGLFALRAILDHPDLELAGVWVHDAPFSSGVDGAAIEGRLQRMPVRLRKMPTASRPDTHTKYLSGLNLLGG